MSYLEFKNQVVLKLEDMFPESTKVEINEITKNNNEVLDALVIKEEGMIISPTIYLDYYYDRYTDGETIDFIVSKIKSNYEKHKITENVDFSFYSDYEQIKDKIVYRLVNKKLNSELLESVPFIPYLDLAIVFHVRLELDSIGTGTVLIRNEHMKIWGVNELNLMEMAQANTLRLEGIKVESLGDFYGDKLGENEQEFLQDNLYATPVFIISNSSTVSGASAILNEGVLRRLAKRVERDLIIVPSSIHEVLAIPAMEEFDDTRINEMICFINENNLDPKEVLSDHTYFYNLKLDALSM